MITAEYKSNVFPQSSFSSKIKRKQEKKVYSKLGMSLVDRMFNDFSSPRLKDKQSTYDKKLNGPVGALNGTVYEVKLMMWFLLHFYNEKKSYKMLAEWENAELVDDIVILYQEDKDARGTFMQLKYRADGKPISKRDFLDGEENTEQKIPPTDTSSNSDTRQQNEFLLRKYFQSYCKMMQKKTVTEGNVKHIAIVTTSDLKNDIVKFFEKDKEAGILGTSPQSFVYKLKMDDESSFLKEVEENLKISHLATLAKLIYNRHGKQNETTNALEYRVTQLRPYKKFLSKHVFERSATEVKYVVFQQGFRDGKYGSDADSYKDVIDKFRAEIIKKFGAASWKTSKFKASDNFCVPIVGPLQEEDIPFKFSEDDVKNFLKVLRVVKTEDEVKISELIKKVLSQTFPSIDKDAAHDRLFVKMLNWYKKPKGYCLTPEESEKWFKELGFNHNGDNSDKLQIAELGENSGAQSTKNKPKSNVFRRCFK